MPMTVADLPFVFVGSWDWTEFEPGKWYARLLSNGTLTITKNVSLDILLVGGGQGGRCYSGGNGGRYAYYQNQAFVANTEIGITIGTGGSGASNSAPGNGTPSYWGTTMTSDYGPITGDGGRGGSAENEPGADGPLVFGGDTAPFDAMRFAGGGGYGGAEKTGGDRKGSKGGNYGGGDAGNQGHGTAGLANTGGGGGGAGSHNDENLGGGIYRGTGGAGGSGVIYIRSMNQAPSEPPFISTDGVKTAGRSTVVSWGASSDADGDVLTYTLERQVDTGAWAQIAVGVAAMSYTASVPTSGTQFRFRVKATDAAGGESSPATSAYVTIDYNNPPTISGEDKDLGVQTGAFDYPFTVNDADAGDALTVTVTLDGAEIMRVPGAQRGVQYTAAVTYERFLRSADGAHTLLITVSDGGEAFADRRITWSRRVMGVDVIIEPQQAQEDMPTQIVFSPFVGLTPDATAHYLACNNYYDAEPAWEDVYPAVINRRGHLFANDHKEAEGWGVAVRVTLTKGNVPGTVYYKEAGVQYA